METSVNTFKFDLDKTNLSFQYTIARMSKLNDICRLQLMHKGLQGLGFVNHISMSSKLVASTSKSAPKII